MEKTDGTIAVLESAKKKISLKKAVLLLAGAAFITLALIIGIEFAEYALELKAREAHGDLLAQQAQSAGGELISQEEAVNHALASVGISQADAGWLHAYLEHEHGSYQYDVSFMNGFYQYNLEVDALSGAITESDIDSIFD